MNIILFEPDEIAQPLPRADARARHILGVLKRSLNEPFDAGLVDGPRGKGWITRIEENALQLAFRWGEPEPPLLPIDLIVGLSRPQTNRKILQEATTLGVRSMRFVTTERGEPSYAQSKLWTSGEWRRHLVEGAAQAFSTRLPEVEYGVSLEEAIEAAVVEGRDRSPSGPFGDDLTVMAARFRAVGDNSACEANEQSAATLVALDNYEATAPLVRVISPGSETVLAVGSERGWSESERNVLRSAGFALAHLGERALRTETAVTVAIGLVANQ